MKHTNITSLRAELSQILDAVRQGEEFEILDRKVPIARLVPVSPGMVGAGDRLPPWLEQRRRAGTVRVGSLRPVTEILAGFPEGTPLTGNTAVEALLEDRRSGP